MRLKPSLPRINRSHPLSRKLKAVYPFFEGGGDTRLLDIARSSHGTFQNTPSWVVSNPYGYALSFAGGTDAVSMPAILSSTATQFSVSILVKADTNSTRYDAFEYNNEGRRLLIRFNGSSGATANEIAMFVQHGGGSDNVTTTAATVTQWRLILCTAISSGNIELYVDGISRGSTALSGSLDVAATLGRFIGINRDGSSNGLSGDVAATWLWDRALTAGEAWSLYVDPWSMFRPSRNNVALDSIVVPLGEVSVAGRIDALVGVNSVSTKEFNRTGSFGVRVSMHGGITKDFRNVQTFAGAMGIVAELDGVVSAQFTREREGRIDIVAEFSSAVTFEKMKTGQLDAVVEMVAEKSEGDTPVTDQDIGEAIVFRAPKIDYVFRAKKHPTGRTL